VVEGFPIPAGCSVFIRNRHATAAYFISANVGRGGNTQEPPGTPELSGLSLQIVINLHIRCH